jgi:outer membrane protein OmpA-like peptidoglycan-associated protein
VGDSLAKTDEDNLKNFVIDYFNQNAHVSVLRISKADRETLQVDSFFTDLDESVEKYVFTYRQNITDLEGADNQLKARNLLQWLRANPDINVQINGYSDEHEYNRVNNDTIISFIDSIPTFEKLKNDVVKKGYLRPEMMRAMKIVKYLYDNGIAAERLSGTAMVFSSSNKREAMDNMKCTLTLDKVHKSPSLYEFHYGKKKEE